MSYPMVRRLADKSMKETGRSLVRACTDLANSIANKQLKNLTHFLATRTIPVRKKNGSARPVGIGDVIRRIVLKAIERQHRDKVAAMQSRQLGGGLNGGMEAILHSLREVSSAAIQRKNLVGYSVDEGERMCILSVDASNVSIFWIDKQH